MPSQTKSKPNQTMLNHAKETSLDLKIDSIGAKARVEYIEQIQPFIQDETFSRGQRLHRKRSQEM